MMLTSFIAGFHVVQLCISIKGYAMDHDDIIWLSGILEGEGWFSKSTEKNPSNIIVGMNTTDYDVAERVAGILGVSVVNRSHGPKAPDYWKPSYLVRASGKRAYLWMTTLQPLMSQRRQKAIEAALNSYRPTDRSKNAYRAWETRRKKYGVSGHA